MEVRKTIDEAAEVVGSEIRKKFDVSAILDDVRNSMSKCYRVPMLQSRRPMEPRGIVLKKVAYSAQSTNARAKWLSFAQDDCRTVT